MISVHPMTVPSPDTLAADRHMSEISRLYTADEGAVLQMLQAEIDLNATERESVEQHAAGIVTDLRAGDRKTPLIDQFLSEYSLSTDEGVILMRLAESLLRTPDRATRNMLFRDRLGGGDWQSHDGHSDFGVVNLSTRGLSISKRWIESSGGPGGQSLLGRLGDRVLGAAIGMAMVVMGEHFVLGRNIGEALKNAGHYRDAGFCFSFDMLGEAALTAKDAETYFAAYMMAIETLAASPEGQDGLSVKLSALHPRYELAQAERCVPVLVDRLRRICLVARQANIGVSIDAEEAERLEISLGVIKGLMDDPALAGWDGLGVVVQAYQRRASAVIRWLAEQCRLSGRRMPVRLVKGAYWDSEIKRAQELGLESYPVFTRKENTDVSYLACAALLFRNTDVFFPQFATHNAHTAAAVIALARGSTDYEFQCLHGMGETLHRVIFAQSGVRSRIYAPVGQHADLLPYLVRRLLENGANSSFVNQLFDPSMAVADIVRDPVTVVTAHCQVESDLLPAPRNHLGGKRLAAAGIDLNHRESLQGVTDWLRDAANRSVEQAGDRAISNPANSRDIIGCVEDSTPENVRAAFEAAGRSGWPEMPAGERAAILRRAGRMFSDATPELLPLIVREAGKSYADAVAEIREAVDFCNYYADQCAAPSFAGRQALGTVACISPWNFPMAIFLGQITASLAAGNTVVAKPAEQTPLIARCSVEILRAAGVPADALHLVLGAAEIGRALVSDAAVAGICFTGSTETAKIIHQTLLDEGRPLVPLIGETGGINAMIVDSTALLEQAVGDVIASSFQSAGQRCSACRVVCVQEDVADAFVEMLAGAMTELKVGDPSDPSVDVGPVIDADAASMLRNYISDGAGRFRVIAEASAPQHPKSDLFVSPIAFEIPSLDVLTREIFGPVLHVYRYAAGRFDQVVDQVNSLGYGLTMGLHTRIDARAEAMADRAKVGNLYVNRNQIGAVVGVQPFGGEGLSGTGPKAGGPFYLQRLSRGKSPDAAAEFLLPGPTGEENRLRLFPRGELVYLGKPDIDLIERAIAMGNSVVRGAVLGNLSARLSAGEFAGFLLGSGGLDVYRKLDLSGTPGLLPILTADDPDWRFMVERTISTDTTAAGGNASLLAGTAG